MKIILNGSCPANIVFEDDKLYKDEVSSSVSWINDDIRISYNNEQKTLFIQSPTLYTDMNMIPRYAGMYYMKILTPQLIEELINLVFLNYYQKLLFFGNKENYGNIIGSIILLLILNKLLNHFFLFLSLIQQIPF